MMPTIDGSSCVTRVACQHRSPAVRVPRRRDHIHSIRPALRRGGGGASRSPHPDRGIGGVSSRKEEECGDVTDSTVHRVPF